MLSEAKGKRVPETETHMFKYPSCLDWNTLVAITERNECGRVCIPDLLQVMSQLRNLLPLYDVWTRKLALGIVDTSTVLP